MQNQPKTPFNHDSSRCKSSAFVFGLCVFPVGHSVTQHGGLDGPSSVSSIRALLTLCSYILPKTGYSNMCCCQEAKHIIKLSCVLLFQQCSPPISFST